VADDETPFDLTILPRFEERIVTWPREQAVIALRIVRAVIAGDEDQKKELLDAKDGEWRELTFEQFREVAELVRRLGAVLWKR
jgi:hypothetical protein